MIMNSGGKMNKALWRLGFCVLALVCLSGRGECAPAAPHSGGTLTVGVELEFRGFDPLKANFLGIADRTVIMAVEERLFDMDAKGNLVPELALSAKPAKDGKSWTVKLRKGVSFHDGTPFNADAVVAHWQRLLDPKNKYFARYAIAPIETVQKVDDFTVRFLLKHPWAPFKSALAAPQSFAVFIPSPKAVQEDTQNRAPVGTGPYMFKEWLPNDRLTVVRNPHYWRKGKAYLDSVVFRPMPDMQARFCQPAVRGERRHPDRPRRQHSPGTGRSLPQGLQQRCRPAPTISFFNTSKAAAERCPRPPGPGPCLEPGSAAQGGLQGDPAAGERSVRRAAELRRFGLSGVRSGQGPQAAGRVRQAGRTGDESHQYPAGQGGRRDHAAAVQGGRRDPQAQPPGRRAAGETGHQRRLPDDRLEDDGF